MSELLEDLAGQATGQTWNRHRAALGSLWSYAHKRGWVASNIVQGVARRRAVTTRRGEQRKRTIPMPTLERLWGNRGTAGRNVVHPLRERTFWRLAYDTAARADELLNLNIEDLDLQDRSAPVVGKGGEARRVRWTTGTNRLLRELVGGRTRGPLLVTDRRPTNDVATPTATPTPAAPVSATAALMSCSRRRPPDDGRCISCATPACRTLATTAWTSMP